MPIGEAWALERPALRPLPGKDFACCVTRPVVPDALQPGRVRDQPLLGAGGQGRSRTWCSRPIRSGWTSCTWSDVLASHPRCYGKNQDIFNPLHYLPLLEQRPGAFAACQAAAALAGDLAAGL